MNKNEANKYKDKFILAKNKFANRIFIRPQRRNIRLINFGM
jgi:hypothetical protein